MLKYWVGLLVLLNAIGLAWQWGALAPWGFSPPQHQEPERLKQQLRPEAVQPVPVPPELANAVQPAPEAMNASTPAPASASDTPAPAPQPMPVATPAAPAMAPR